jgi:hypothetical protein
LKPLQIQYSQVIRFSYYQFYLKFVVQNHHLFSNA